MLAQTVNQFRSFGAKTLSSKQVGGSSLRMGQMQYVWNEDLHRFLDLADARISIGHRHPLVLGPMISQLHQIGIHSSSVEHPEVTLLKSELQSTISETEDWTVTIGSSVGEILSVIRKQYPGRIGNHSMVAAIDLNIDYWVRFLEENRPSVVMLKPLDPMGRLWDPEYLQMVVEAATLRGSRIMIDETLTGMGRMGRWWGHQEYPMLPDLILSGDILTSGITSIGVLLSKEPISTESESNFSRPIPVQNPLAAVAARSVMRVIERERYLDRSLYLGTQIESVFATLRMAEPELFGPSDGIGALHRIHLPNRSFGWNVPWKLRDRGIRVNAIDSWNYLSIFAPLCLSDFDVATLQRELLEIAVEYRMNE